MSEEEWEEVTDYRKITALGIITAVVIFFGLVYFGIIDIYVLDFSQINLPEINQETKVDQTEKPKQDIKPVKQGEPDNTPKQTDPFNHNQNEIPFEEVIPVDQQLLNLYLEFGLNETDIRLILSDDCSKYQNNTDVVIENYEHLQYQGLITAKIELCANG